MKYLVVSDSHGDRQILVNLLDRYEGKVDVMIHCGDSELRYDDELWQHFKVVTGNCDYDPRYLKKQVITTDLDRIFVTHGHLSNVRMGLTTLKMQALEEKATIALFGHTHQIGCESEEGILFLNPGSISQPRGPLQYKSYAIIASDRDGYNVQYYTRDFSPITDLNFVFPKANNR